MRPGLAVAAFATLLLAIAGCASKPDPPASEAPVGLPPATAGDERVVVDVPVPIVLVGFANGTGAALKAELGGSMVVEHETYNFAFEFPPTVVATSGGDSGRVPLVLVPRAVFSVQEASPATAEALRNELTGASEDGLWSANLAEDELAEILPAMGVALDPSAPALVFLDLDSPGYRYRQTTGYLDGVRVFGERRPLLALDVSAPADPFVGEGGAYTAPLASSANPQAAAEVLAEAVEDAVNFRLLQGPIYPPTLKECHAVTLAIGVRAASAAQVVEGDYAEAVDTAILQRAWTNATAGEVAVDVLTFRLPVDDPGLDAALRAASSSAPGGLDALRQWAAMNWDDYWVPHDGCEAYVSFLIVGDAGDAQLFGIAMYDVAEGHRVSLSVVPDTTRLQEGLDGPLSPLNPTAESRESPNWANFLFAHETGHLLGQRHPHDVSLPGGDGDFTFAWSSVWSSMTYESQDRLVDFGAIDQNNHLRNRAGEALQAVYAAGGQPSAEALGLLGARQWDAATASLLAGVPAA